MTTDINNSADVIDTRDLIARIEELTDELLTEFNDRSAAGEDKEDDADKDNERFIGWLDEVADEDESPLQDSASELITLKAFAAEIEGNCSDYEYGETLIRDSYFTAYIEELINDCYEMPKELKEGSCQWPWRHCMIDYEAAADEAKQDYSSAEFDGETYWFRA